jgi:hypothetical protein
MRHSCATIPFLPMRQHLEELAQMRLGLTMDRAEDLSHLLDGDLGGFFPPTAVAR